jgi:hypothetical protein
VDDTTRLRPGGASAAVTRPAPGAEWLSSSSSIDHGRFELRTILDSRSRMVGLRRPAGRTALA